MNRTFEGFSGNYYNSAKSIVKKLQDNGHRAFLVGGCVRDALLNLIPNEYDITTSASPKEVQNLFTRNVPIGESFGVILVLLDDLQFEVATFRQESEYKDGRHPSNVKYSSSEIDDVVRRDFTINGMLFDPIENKLYDHVGGEKDLSEGIIRTIGDPIERFGEDKLRMIRAVRFASRLSYKIEENTFNAVIDLGREIKNVSRERIRGEILKIITQKNPGNGIRLLYETKILEHILPEVSDMVGIEQPPEFHPEGDVFIHTCIVLDKLYEITDGFYSPELAMGALLHDIGKPPTFERADRIRFNGHDRVGADMAKGVCKNLRFSKKQTERITSLIREHLKFKDTLKMKESTLKRFLSIPYFDEHLTMHLADCLGSHGIRDVYDFLKNKLENFEEEELKPTPLINGNDLIKLGYQPGPLFSVILGKVEEQQLEGIIKNKDDALSFIRDNFNS
ncbi:MAG: CCA tRNA nucleotidyltransferase [Thermodesulfobacteriota bacterium]